MFQAENFPEYENECMNILKLGIWGKKTFLEFKVIAIMNEKLRKK